MSTVTLKCRMMVGYYFTILCIICAYVCVDARFSTIVVNNAGGPIQLFWMDTANIGALKDQSGGPMRNDSQVHFYSYQNHQFVAKFSPPVDGTEVILTKGNREETFEISYDNALGKLVVKRTTKLDTFITEVKSSVKQCSHVVEDEYHNCIEAHIPEATRVIDSGERLKTQNNGMAKRLREYLCNDSSLTSTKPIETFTRTLVGKNVTFDILLDTSHAKIWTVEDFITEEECNTLFDAVKDRFQTSTVFASNGSSVLDSARRAKDAGYGMYGGTSDPLWALYHRVVATINLKTGWQLSTAGQEGFAVIHYDPSEQYLSHCDSKCEGQPYLNRGRVATAVLYCKVAEEGGATTFTKADVFVKPKAGMATFFSYKGPDGRMDDGYTEHSGCPVIKGEKMITTAWLREGVDEANPFTGYDSLGQKIPEKSSSIVQEAAVTVEGGV